LFFETYRVNTILILGSSQISSARWVLYLNRRASYTRNRYKIIIHHLKRNNTFLSAISLKIWGGGYLTPYKFIACFSDHLHNCSFLRTHQNQLILSKLAFNPSFFPAILLPVPYQKRDLESFYENKKMPSSIF